MVGREQARVNNWLTSAHSLRTNNMQGGIKTRRSSLVATMKVETAPRVFGRKVCVIAWLALCSLCASTAPANSFLTAFLTSHYTTELIFAAALRTEILQACLTIYKHEFMPLYLVLVIYTYMVRATFLHSDAIKTRISFFFMLTPFLCFFFRIFHSVP